MKIKFYILIYSLVIVSCKTVMKETTKNNDVDYIINVVDYGAVGDGVSDDSKVFQKAISAAKNSDVRLIYIPPRRYYFEKPVTIDIEGLKIYGKGGLSYQVKPSWYISGKEGLQSLFIIKDGEDANNSIEFEGINFFSKSLIKGKGVTNAIEVKNTIHVNRPFTMKGCSFRGFNAAIHFNSEDTNNQYTWAFINIFDNVFVGNYYSVLATSGIIGFRFERNESEAGGRIQGNI